VQQVHAIRLGGGTASGGEGEEEDAATQALRAQILGGLKVGKALRL
jgi:hypothetical protein